jgi:hypothetical protein
MFQKIHGMGSLKNARNGKFLKCTELNVSNIHEIGSLKIARNGNLKNAQNRMFKKCTEWEVLKNAKN